MKTKTAPRKNTSARKKKTVRRRKKAVDIKRILVPLDGSDHALKALHYGVQFARMYGARLDTLRVVPTETSATGFISRERMRYENQALRLARQETLATCGRMIPDSVRWKNRVVAGIPYVQILKHAKEEKTDLMLLATHGYTGMKHFFLGGYAELITRHAPCPVMIVRTEEHDFA